MGTVLNNNDINLDLWIAKYAYGKNHSVDYDDKDLPIMTINLNESVDILQVAESGVLKTNENGMMDIDRAYRNYPKLVKSIVLNNLNSKEYKKVYRKFR